jgi:hypothetical protein
MRIAVLLSSIVVAAVLEAGAQTTPAKPTALPQPGTTQTTPAKAPAQPQTGTPQTTPAKPPAQPQTGTPQTTPAPAQTRKPTTSTSTRSGMAITVADPRGVTLTGVRVEAMGPTLRDGDTNASGQINYAGIMPGVYRLRFSGDGWITFEREVTLRSGQIADVDVTLNPAPKPPPAPEPPAPQPVVVQAPAPGPKGEAWTIGIEGVLEKDYIGKELQRDSLLSCSGSERAMMIQLNGAMEHRLYENGETVYYVLGGEGTATINGRKSSIKTNDFVSVPRGTVHAFDRTGKRALVLLAVLSGEPCERVK